MKHDVYARRVLYLFISFVLSYGVVVCLFCWLIMQQVYLIIIDVLS